MTQRGRGLLEIKPSTNPFFQPTSADIGSNPSRKITWTGEVDTSSIKNHRSATESFSFLYTRESDTIGSRVSKPTGRMTVKPMTKAEFLKTRREEVLAMSGIDRSKMEDVVYDNSIRPSKTLNANGVLSVYHHDPKFEDPRFLTTNVRRRVYLML